MSHFSEIKTNLKDKSQIKKSLSQMGFQIVEEEGGVDVRGFFGDTTKAEFKVLTKSHYDIGFVKNALGGYEVVGDWELMPRVADIAREPFLADLKKRYAKNVIQEIAEERGFSLEMNENETDGSMEMVVSKW